MVLLTGYQYHLIMLPVNAVRPQVDTASCARAEKVLNAR